MEGVGDGLARSGEDGGDGVVGTGRPGEGTGIEEARGVMLESGEEWGLRA